MLVMAVLLGTMYVGIGLAADRPKGITDWSRSLVVWRLAPVTGALLGDLARYLLAASLVIGLELAIGFRPAGGAPGTLAATGLLLVFALALSWSWTTLGLLVRTPQAGDEHRYSRAVPAHLGQQLLRRPAQPCPAGCRPWCASTPSPTWSPPSAR